MGMRLGQRDREFLRTERGRFTGVGDVSGRSNQGVEMKGRLTGGPKQTEILPGKKNLAHKALLQGRV